MQSHDSPLRTTGEGKEESMLLEDEVYSMLQPSRCRNGASAGHVQSQPVMIVKTQQSSENAYGDDSDFNRFLSETVAGVRPASVEAKRESPTKDSETSQSTTCDSEPSTPPVRFSDTQRPQPPRSSPFLYVAARSSKPSAGATAATAAAGVGNGNRQRSDGGPFAAEQKEDSVFRAYTPWSNESASPVKSPKVAGNSATADQTQRSGVGRINMSKSADIHFPPVNERTPTSSVSLHPFDTASEDSLGSGFGYDIAAIASHGRAVPSPMDGDAAASSGQRSQRLSSASSTGQRDSGHGGKEGRSLLVQFYDDPLTPLLSGEGDRSRGTSRGSLISLDVSCNSTKRSALRRESSAGTASQEVSQRISPASSSKTEQSAPSTVNGRSIPRPPPVSIAPTTAQDPPVSVNARLAFRRDDERMGEDGDVDDDESIVVDVSSHRDSNRQHSSSTAAANSLKKECASRPAVTALRQQNGGWCLPDNVDRLLRPRQSPDANSNGGAPLSATATPAACQGNTAHDQEEKKGTAETSNRISAINTAPPAGVAQSVEVGSQRERLKDAQRNLTYISVPLLRNTTSSGTQGLSSSEFVRGHSPSSAQLPPGTQSPLLAKPPTTPPKSSRAPRRHPAGALYVLPAFFSRSTSGDHKKN